MLSNIVHISNKINGYSSREPVAPNYNTVTPLRNYKSLNVSSTELKYLVIKPVIYSETNGGCEFGLFDMHPTAIGIPTNSKLISFSVGHCMAAWNLLDYLPIIITHSISDLFNCMYIYLYILTGVAP